MFVFFLIILFSVLWNISSFVCHCCFLCRSLYPHLNCFFFMLKKKHCAHSDVVCILYYNRNYWAIWHLSKKSKHEHTFEHLVFFQYDLLAVFIPNSRQFSGFYLYKLTIGVSYDLLNTSHYEHPVFLIFDWFLSFRTPVHLIPNTLCFFLCPDIVTNIWY
jgi:hypothetical protein